MTGPMAIFYTVLLFSLNTHLTNTLEPLMPGHEMQKEGPLLSRVSDTLASVMGGLRDGYPCREEAWGKRKDGGKKGNPDKAKRTGKPGLALHQWVTMLPKGGKRSSRRREQREQRKAPHVGCVVGSGPGVACGYFLRSEGGQP